MANSLRARPDKVDVRTFVEHQPGRPDGITQPFHAGHAAGAQFLAVHQQCIELHPSVAGEKAAAAGSKVSSSSRTVTAASTASTAAAPFSAAAYPACRAFEHLAGGPPACLREWPRRRREREEGERIASRLAYPYDYLRQNDHSTMTMVRRPSEDHRSRCVRSSMPFRDGRGGGQAGDGSDHETGKTGRKVVPVDPEAEDIFGFASGRLEIVGEIVGPVVPLEEWEVLK